MTIEEVIKVCTISWLYAELDRINKGESLYAGFIGFHYANKHRPLLIAELNKRIPPGSFIPFVGCTPLFRKVFTPSDCYSGTWPILRLKSWK